MHWFHRLTGWSAQLQLIKLDRGLMMSKLCRSFKHEVLLALRSAAQDILLTASGALFQRAIIMPRLLEHMEFFTTVDLPRNGKISWLRE